MKIEGKEKNIKKFNGNTVLANIDELVYISYNLNLATNKYLDDYGVENKAKVKFWNEKMSNFINNTKINENEKTD